VSWQNGWWRARIRVGDKTIHLGTFEDDVEAARAFDRAMMLYRPYRGVLNFPAEWNAHKSALLLQYGQMIATGRKRTVGSFADDAFCESYWLFQR
jgi:hypothetical protein